VFAVLTDVEVVNGSGRSLVLELLDERIGRPVDAAPCSDMQFVRLFVGIVRV